MPAIRWISSAATTSSGIQFPILTDPLHNMFALLTGQTPRCSSSSCRMFTFRFAEEIPVIAIAPFAGLFLDVKLLYHRFGHGVRHAGIARNSCKMSASERRRSEIDRRRSGRLLSRTTRSSRLPRSGAFITRESRSSGGVSLAAKAIVSKLREEYLPTLICILIRRSTILAPRKCEFQGGRGAYQWQRSLHGSRQYFCRGRY